MKVRIIFVEYVAIKALKIRLCFDFVNAIIVLSSSINVIL